MSDLCSLRIQELNRMLKHIKLGKEHLTQYLSPTHFTELLKLGNLQDEQKEHIATDFRENTGNASVIINTIITSIFGGWLGMTGFGLFKFSPYLSIVIVITALVIGGLIGYLGYQLTRKQAQEAGINQKLYNIQIKILDLIVKKRDAAIKSTQDNITNMISSLIAEKISPITEDELLLYFLPRQKKYCILRKKINNIMKHINDKKIRQHYRATANHIYKILQKTALKLQANKQIIDEKSHLSLSYSYDAKDLLLNTALTNASYIRILTKPDLPVKKLIPKTHQWLRKNLLGICVGLMPTVLGTFASMFVFLNGIPAIINALDIHFSSPISTASLKYISLFIAISIPCYFGYSHLHSNYKAYRRAKQLELAENKVTEKAAKMIQQETYLHGLIKINYNLRQLIAMNETIFLLLEKDKVLSS